MAAQSDGIWARIGNAATVIDEAVSRGQNPVGGNDTTRATHSYHERELALLDFFPAQDFGVETWNLSSQ
ncbi:MAG: hypothetical protein OXL36_14810 [Bryobacterales bacterium]|nr:hypothetical protein [Bryobacterales bacterium]